MKTPKKIIKKNIVYVQTCSTCKREFQVSECSKEEICYDCKTENAVNKALENCQFLIGAEIIEIKPSDNGHLTSYYEIDLIKVRTKDGRIIEFEADGWEDRYISWEEKT